ncbi:hypothetical protein KCP70_22825 [Salmonella enterica subsp. enterica]|nr:hypothetical protein KCP70_22825 [Salmonella enterica subsp. enterica]
MRQLPAHRVCQQLHQLAILHRPYVTGLRSTDRHHSCAGNPSLQLNLNGAHFPSRKSTRRAGRQEPGNNTACHAFGYL